MNWHDFYYDHMPKWAKNSGPPFGTYNYAASFLRPHEYIGDLYRECKFFIQRGYRGYSDRDVWGWYDYMADINVKALRHLAKRKIGHPCGMTMQGWRNRLLKMADGFQATIDEENDYTSYKKLSRKEFLALVRSRRTRLAQGLKLYSKHFQSLWD